MLKSWDEGKRGLLALLCCENLGAYRLKPSVAEALEAEYVL